MHKHIEVDMLKLCSRERLVARRRKYLDDIETAKKHLANIEDEFQRRGKKDFLKSQD